MYPIKYNFIHNIDKLTYFINGGAILKKIYIGIAVAVALVVGSLIFFKFKDTSLDKTIEKVKAYDKYVLTCNMEMVENDELKSYLVNVSYFKEKRMSIIKLNFMISH